MLKLLRQLIILLFFSSINLFAMSMANATQFAPKDCSANLVFDTFDHNQSKIMLQKFRGGVWTEPTLVHRDSNNQNFNPVVSGDISGNTVVVWPVEVRGQTRIMYRVEKANASWEDDARYLSNADGESTTPTILSDLNSGIWLAWASDRAGLDDIFIAKWRNGSWSKPKMVHKTNDVPDIAPRLKRENNEIILTWRRYSRSTKNYVEQSSVISSYELAAKNSGSLSRYCDSITEIAGQTHAYSSRVYIDKSNVITDYRNVFNLR